MTPELLKIFEDFTLAMHELEATDHEIPEYEDTVWQYVSDALRNHYIQIGDSE